MNFESFFSLSYGLYIVSSSNSNGKNGYIANTVFQVSSEPPQLGVSCSKNNLTTSLIASSGKFSVSVLKQQASAELIGLFGYKSGRETDKFKSVQFETGNSGVPIVTQDSVAWFECEVSGQIDVGSHIIFIGKVLECEILEKETAPLTYAWYREVKKGLSPKNAPTYVDPAKVEHKPEVSKSTNGKRYQCLACSFIYDPAIGDPDGGIPPGTNFEDIPDDWMCPVCGATKDMFEEVV